MIKLNDIINNQIEKIERVLIKNQINSTDMAISMYLLSSWKKKIELPSIQNFANILSLSVSSISKYIKKYELEGFPVLKFIYSINYSLEKETINEMSIDEKTKIASEKILKSRRVLLVGAGNSGLIAKSLYTRLILLDINAIYLEGKPDQINMMNRMTDNDVVICISFSLSHVWTKNLLESNINSIIFTAQNPTVNKSKIIFTPKISKVLKYSQTDHASMEYVNKKIDDILRYIEKKK